MEERTDSPLAVKVEEHSNFVILTYFQGDINSMVDAHFNRALKKDYNPKESAAKTNKFSKAIKLEKTVGTCQASVSESYSEPQASSIPEHLLTITTANNTRSSWASFPTRTVEGPGMPTISYSLSPDGLSMTGQQYASSLLNLLQSDRGEMGPAASSSKPELHPSWTLPQGFRESVDPAAAFEPGRHLEKKDLYWY